MGNHREIEIRGLNLIIYDHDLEPFTGTDLLGCSVWDCAIILAHYLPNYARSHPFASNTVLELGAGTGLPGLVAAALGAPRVTLTDRTHLLPGLRRNVEANAHIFSSDVRVAALEWGREDQVAAVDGQPFDLVLMSDLLYNVSSVKDLCRTLKAVTDRRSEILLSYELREGTTECFRVLREEGFGWEKVGKEELDPVWQSDDIGIFKVYYL
ncbi:uncharacterized protein [Aristolochia californica]|uniref:uncharacterized protein n=1 Tax=Aristolochia californica TaxID=171875 RepID=UPI0035DEDF88